LKYSPWFFFLKEHAPFLQEAIYHSPAQEKARDDASFAFCQQIAKQQLAQAEEQEDSPEETKRKLLEAK